MVHLRQQRDVKIAAVAGHQKAEDLSRSVGQHLVPARPALDHHEHRPGRVALADQVDLGTVMPGHSGRHFKRGRIFGPQRRERTQLGDEAVVHGTRFHIYQFITLRSLIV